MRKALNENPKVQLAAVAVLLVVGALFALPMLKGGDEPATDPTPVSATGAGAVGDPAAASATPTPSGALPATSAGVTPVSSVSTGTVPAGATSVSPEALIPGPGLPRKVVRSWARGDAIVLLIVRPGAVDDRLVKSSVAALSGDSELSVFVANARNVARYSRITQGVGVNRVPALVVVRPRRLSGGTPQATVSYGFRNAQSVRQAVDDALYAGRDDVPYHPD